MTEDFTTLQIGELAADQRAIIRCPSCGRNGALERKENGVRRCVHVEHSTVDPVRLRTFQTDVCQIAGPRPESFAESILKTAS